VNKILLRIDDKYKYLKKYLIIFKEHRVQGVLTSHYIVGGGAYEEF